MKTAFSISLLGATLIWNAVPQSNLPPARLAIVVEDSSVAAAGYVLTTELSQRSDLQLLERAEIERVYHEQALSAGNKDYLKFGQILGADCLLILSAIAESSNQVSKINLPGIAARFGGSAQNDRRNLDLRLVAVRPGVVLRAIRAVW